MTIETMTVTTGWVACDYTESDKMDGCRHGQVRETYEQAAADNANHDYDGVRYVHTDGHLYVDQQS